MASLPTTLQAGARSTSDGKTSALSLSRGLVCNVHLCTATRFFLLLRLLMCLFVAAAFEAGFGGSVDLARDANGMKRNPLPLRVAGSTAPLCDDCDLTHAHQLGPHRSLRKLVSLWDHHKCCFCCFSVLVAFASHSLNMDVGTAAAAPPPPPAAATPPPASPPPPPALDVGRLYRDACVRASLGRSRAVEHALAGSASLPHSNSACVVGSGRGAATTAVVVGVPGALRARPDGRAEIDLSRTFVGRDGAVAVARVAAAAPAVVSVSFADSHLDNAAVAAVLHALDDAAHVSSFDFSGNATVTGAAGRALAAFARSHANVTAVGTERTGVNAALRRAIAERAAANAALSPRAREAAVSAQNAARAARREAAERRAAAAANAVDVAALDAATRAFFGAPLASAAGGGAVLRCLALPPPPPSATAQPPPALRALRLLAEATALSPTRATAPSRATPRLATAEASATRAALRLDPLSVRETAFSAGCGSGSDSGGSSLVSTPRWAPSATPDEVL